MRCSYIVLRTCLEVLRSMGNPTGERASRAGVRWPIVPRYCTVCCAKDGSSCELFGKLQRCSEYRAVLYCSVLAKKNIGKSTSRNATLCLKCNSKSTSEPHGRAYRLKHSAVGYGTDIKAIHYERSVVYILYTEKHIGQHVLVFAYVHMYLYRGC